jgi:hypothetical protein
MSLYASSGALLTRIIHEGAPSKTISVLDVECGDD